MPSAIKKIVEQFLKDVDKSPGWLPLVISIYLLIDLKPAAEFFTYLSTSLGIFKLEFPDELLVAVIAAIAYMLGDAVDSKVFRATPSTVTLREAAQDKLGVKDGSYEVALKLARAAEKQRKRKSISFWNESAKFLRSFPVVAALIVIEDIYFVRPQFLVLWLILAGIGFRLYLTLKNWHMQVLYSLAPQLKELRDRKEDRPYYRTHDLSGIRMFFWDGKFVTACTRHPRDT